MYDQGGDTVAVEVSGHEARLDKYRVLLDRMEAAALTPERSQTFVHNILKDL
ncbi:hypothetical protein [Streptomyces rhizosphaerihabitans]|uniref:hypothetical protein n=1 Tax=Streptomyces rhizosphaerihabitans TaxID=1266770 RepID=UPI0021BEC0F3|nr:hypothetical protein [Streptomyces rhizosphaerihabitans]MCT9003690.1 hypothetical protein [Streptomyces rhizosphaerihabitans]